MVELPDSKPGYLVAVTLPASGGGSRGGGVVVRAGGGGSRAVDEPNEPLPLPGPQKVECPDGCGKFGRPIKSRSGHVRGCPCKPCLGGRNSKGGKARHRRFAKRAGITIGKWSTSQEEAWRDPFRWEVKSGAQVRAVFTAYENARAQSEASRPLGDPRPFAFGVEPLSSRERALVVLDAEVWRELIAPLLRASL